MGTHPNGPATIVHEKQLLSEYISANPDSLGDKIREKFGDQLPFLFKAKKIPYNSINPIISSINHKWMIPSHFVYVFIC